MADFVLKKHSEFTFALEEDTDRVYKLPPMSKLSFEEMQLTLKIADEKNLVKQGRMVKDFILSYVPELADKGLSDAEYLMIYNEYGLSEGKTSMGESTASASS